MQGPYVVANVIPSKHASPFSFTNSLELIFSKALFTRLPAEEPSGMNACPSICTSSPASHSAGGDIGST